MRRTTLVFALAATCLASQNGTNISGTPDKIQAGESTRITWTTPCQSAFLSGVGKVHGSGSLDVSPDSSTNYTIVCDAPQGVKFSSTTVDVQGERGTPDLPDPFDFPKGQQGQRKSISYADFLDLAFKTLQDRMKFTVYSQHAPHDQFFVFFTDRRPQPELLYLSDRGIRARRVAYEVQIFDPGKSTQFINYEIRTIAEYQRLGEAAWRPENNQKVTDDAISRLRQNLETTQ
jgi:hypothetical protein